MAKLAHPRPEAIAIAECVRLLDDCPCRIRKGGFPPGQRIDRRLCEHKYLAAIQIIIDRIRADDPP